MDRGKTGRDADNHYYVIITGGEEGWYAPVAVLTHTAGLRSWSGAEFRQGFADTEVGFSYRFTQQAHPSQSLSVNTRQSADGKNLVKVRFAPETVQIAECLRAQSVLMWRMLVS